jgi:hypothetical protein
LRATIEKNANRAANATKENTEDATGAAKVGEMHRAATRSERMAAKGE